MALTLHFQRGAQSLQTGEGVSWVARVPSPACPRTPAPPIHGWVLSGSHCLLEPQVTELFVLKLGGGVGLPATLGDS